MAIDRPQPSASLDGTASSATAARSISKEERGATIKLAQQSIESEEKRTSSGGQGAVSSDSDVDSDISNSTSETAESSKICIPFPPKQRGKGPRTRGTRTKLVVFYYTQDVDRRHKKQLRRLKKEYPTARLDRDRENIVISVITSCLTPEQLLRIKEEKEATEEDKVATRLAEESTQESRQNARFQYEHERQLDEFRDGKCDVGTIEWEEEMKTWSQEKLDRYEVKNRVNAQDLRTILLELEKGRSKGENWRLRECVEVDTEESFFGDDFAIRSSEER